MNGLNNAELRPLPAITELTAPYWAAAQDRRLVIQRCSVCGHFQHPPAPVCQQCRGTELRWDQVSGNGRVYEYTVVRMGRIDGFGEDPYTCVTVELDEQPRLFVLANWLAPAPESSIVGRAVEVTWEVVREGFVLPQFRPAGAGS